MSSSLFPQNQNPVRQIQQLLTGGMTPQKAKEIIQDKLKRGEISQSQLEDAMTRAQSIISMVRR